MDLADGLPPLCIYDYADYRSAELPGALPVIYPVKAGGTGVTDPDFEMIKYAQTQFEHHNVFLLTGNLRDGVEAYKRYHRIQTDEQEAHCPTLSEMPGAGGADTKPEAGPLRSRDERKADI